MIFELSPKERKELRNIEESYRKLITEARELELKLAPSEPPKDVNLYEEWLKSGSQEWRDAREKLYELIRASSESRAKYLRGVFDEHFAALGNDPDAIVKSACDEIDSYIQEVYKGYEKTRTTGINEYGTVVTAFSARDVRKTDSGLLLDAERTIEELSSSVVSRHLEALKDDAERTALINEYIVKAVAESPYTSSTVGELGGKVDVDKQELAIRPTKYVTTVDRVTQKFFGNKLTRPLDVEDDALYDLRLDKYGKVTVRVAIDYKELLSKGTLVSLPELNDRDYNVHDAIVTLLSAGNRVMTYDMIYRAMTGKVSGKIEVPDEAREAIDSALKKFKGRFILEYAYKDDKGNDATIAYDEPVVTFRQVKKRINGKIVEGAIAIPSDTDYDPPLLRWARLNGNEIDTRDITLLDVPKLNNGDESFTLKMCLYRRLLSMRNTFERVKKSKHELAENLRTIRYDYVYEALGLSADTLTKDKRHDIKAKIDRCLEYWVSKGFITGYEHKKDKSAGNQYYAVVVSFMPKE